MPNLTLRDVPPDLHLWLKQQASSHRRSLNQQAILLLDASRGGMAGPTDADQRLARIRTVAARSAGLPVVDTRPEAQILGLDGNGIPG